MIGMTSATLRQWAINWSSLRAFESDQAEQAGVVAALAQQGGFGQRLGRRPAYAATRRSAHGRDGMLDSSPRRLIGAAAETAQTRVADSELSRVDAHGQPAGAGCKIIAK